jgi:hypothetical protein
LEGQPLRDADVKGSVGIVLEDKEEHDVHQPETSVLEVLTLLYMCPQTATYAGVYWKIKSNMTFIT